MLRALVDSASAFPLTAEWYRNRKIRWVIDISADARRGWLTAVEVEVAVPEPERSSDINPGLLVDKASYAIGLEDEGITHDSPRFKAFTSLLREYFRNTADAAADLIIQFLNNFQNTPDDSRELRERLLHEARPDDLIAFRTQHDAYPFSSHLAIAFWARHVQSARSSTRAACCVCGQFGPIVSLIPQKVFIAGQSCKISSFNEDAFNSFGRKQTENSPLCFGCASQSSRVLQHLLASERHRRVLTGDESKGTGKAPLRNQWAIFWLKEPLPSLDDGEPVDPEALIASPLNRPAIGAPPAAPEQMRKLYGLPFSSSERALHLDQNRFYVAVLSPNKSRLVLREWIEESVARVLETLKAYDAARTIRTADGLADWRPDIPGMLDSLTPPKSTSASSDANLVRSLLRTAYQGAPPPMKLLEAAVLRFRIQEKAKDKRDELEIGLRRQTLAAAIKFVLTYGKQEANTLQSLDDSWKRGPYLCGRLLAVLEEAQLRASRWRVQATLVDRFYGGASTSPKNTLGILVRQGTIAHMPKIRKIGAGYRDLEQTLESVMAAIDDEGGFPGALTLREQGEFALGFYHQRAGFSSARPSKESFNQDKNK
ncbi:MAG: type I-C CRISPR-associated protein Cas8c/Csd1 [Bryobacteraceae bacterium]